MNIGLVRAVFGVFIVVALACGAWGSAPSAVGGELVAARAAPDAGIPAPAHQHGTEGNGHGASSSKCRYCGSSSYGRSCGNSPNGVHEHIEDSKHCEFCGSTSYGHSCSYSPSGNHRHGSDGEHCRWCGSTSTGRSCSYSPSRAHER